MNNMMKWTSIAATLLLLAACGGAGESPKGKGVKPDRDLVGIIRGAGRTTGSSVEVAPLRDPAVDGFLTQATAQETAGDFNAALASVDRALKLAPDAPDILQLKAELLIGLRKYAEAEALARKSFELGARLGSLCARNWQTVVETRTLAKDEASAASAREHLAACKIPPRQRL
jgi:tetratricopeptide (TPR) repeat protein